jgi:hypothetical protein
MISTRRKFLTGLIAAPLVVSYQNIMPVKLFVAEVPTIDPILYNLIKRNMAQMMAHDILSVQPLWNNPEIVQAVNTLSGRNFSF